MTELEQVVDRGDRGRLWFLIAIGVLCLGIAGTLTYTIVVNHQQGNRIAKIESPCQKYGANSKQCEEAFSLAVSTITHPQACAVERKAGTLRAIRELADELGVDFTEPCAGARIAQERQRSNDRAETRQRQAAAGGDALQARPTGSQQPGPREGGQPGGAGGAHDGDVPASDPPPPAAAPKSATGSPAGTPPIDAPPQRGDRGPVEQTADAATDAVDQVEEEVGDVVKEAGAAVEDIGARVDCALRGGC
jgi:hypothetical protein